MINVVEVTKPGGPEVLKTAMRPDPSAGPDEIVVRVHAANINPTDFGARQGFTFGAPLVAPYVLGWDYAGEVQAVGTNVKDFAQGDRVVGMIPWYMVGGRQGSYAEAITVKAEWTVKLPEQLSYEVACTLPLNALTARQALALLKPDPGSQLLITGASGGVGSFAVQMAVHAGHAVTAVAGRGDEEWVGKLGATKVLPRETDYNTIGRFKNVLDAVPVGDPVLAAVNNGGSVVTTRPTNKAAASRGIRQDIVGIRMDRAALEEIVAQAARGVLITRVSRTFPLEQAAEAHRLYEKGGHKGKIVLIN